MSCVVCELNCKKITQGSGKHVDFFMRFFLGSNFSCAIYYRRWDL